MKPIRKVYLAGPMRGYPEFNFPEFHAAANSLRMRQFEVWSPAERDEKEGLDPKNAEHRAVAEERGLRYYMQHDLPAVCRSDAVALLPNWRKSVGACLEVITAWTLGLPTFMAWSEAPVPAWSIDLTPSLMGDKCFLTRSR